MGNGIRGIVRIIPGNLNSSHPTEKLRFHLKLPFRRSGLPHYHVSLPRLALEVGFDGGDDFAVHDGSPDGLKVEHQCFVKSKFMACNPEPFALDTETGPEMAESLSVSVIVPLAKRSFPKWCR